MGSNYQRIRKKLSSNKANVKTLVRERKFKSLFLKKQQVQVQVEAFTILAGNTFLLLKQASSNLVKEFMKAKSIHKEKVTLLQKVKIYLEKISTIFF